MGPSYHFRSTNIYLVSIEEPFLNRLKSVNLNVNLIASLESKQSIVGSAALNVSEALLFPHNKVQLTAKVMSFDGEKSRGAQKHIGNLSLWVRLTCELDALKQFVEKFWSKGDSNQLKLHTEASESVSEANVPKGETGQSVEQPISNGDAKDGFVFVIQKLKLTDAAVLKEIAENVYVDYSFLGQRHLRTRTQSVVNDVIEFDSSQTYSIDGRSRSRVLKMLQDAKRSIKFNLVKDASEQDSELSIDSREIGFGLMHFAKLFKNPRADGGHEKTVSIPVLLKTPPYQNVGSLEIKIVGADKIYAISSS